MPVHLKKSDKIPVHSKKSYKLPVVSGGSIWDYKLPAYWNIYYCITKNYEMKIGITYTNK